MKVTCKNKTESHNFPKLFKLDGKNAIALMYLIEDGFMSGVVLTTGDSFLKAGEHLSSASPQYWSEYTGEVTLSN